MGHHRVSDPAALLKNSREGAGSRDPYSFENIKRMIAADGSLDLQQKNINQLQVSTFFADDEDYSIVEQIHQQ